MLTPEQVQAARQRLNITTPMAPHGLTPGSSAPDRAQALTDAWSAAPAAPPQPQGSGKGGLYDAVGALEKGAVSSEVNAGQDIGAALSIHYPGVQDALNKAQGANVQLGQVFQKLLQKRHDMALQGKDTTQLDSVLKEDAKTLGMTGIDNLLPDAAKKTPLQIAADFGGMALDVATAGALEEAGTSSWKLVSEANKAKLAEIGVTDAAKAKTLIQTLSGTVKKMAGGAALGYGYDVAGKLQNGESGPAAFTPGAGTAIGAALPLGGDLLALGYGKAKSAITDLADKSAAAKETAVTDRAYKAITPNTKDLTPTEYQDLLRKNRIEPATGGKAPKVILQDQEKALAEKHQALLQSKDPIKNMNSVQKEIINRDTEVGAFLKKDNQVYQKKELRDALVSSISGVDDITIPKARLSQARKDLVDAFMSRIPEKNSGRTYEQLWQFRKLNDQVLQNKLNAFAGSPTLKKEMELSLRDGVQKFIANNTKDGVYAGKMKEMTGLYRLQDLMETAASKTKGLSLRAQWMRAHPVAAKSLKWLLEGAAVSAGAGGIYEAGKKTGIIP